LRWGGGESAQDVVREGCRGFDGGWGEASGVDYEELCGLDYGCALMGRWVVVSLGRGNLGW